MQRRRKGFTIVELLIVIVVIGILAAITIVAFNGVQARAATAKRQSDVATYVKAITIARNNTGKNLGAITGSYWSAGGCEASSGNLGNIEPKNLPKSHICWTSYYDNLAKIGAAAGINLDGLKSGDSRGNPYVLDENEGETASCGQSDAVAYYVGSGAVSATAAWIPVAGC